MMEILELRRESSKTRIETKMSQMTKLRIDDLQRDMKEVREVLIEMYEYGMDTQTFQDRNKERIERWMKEVGD